MRQGSTLKAASRQLWWQGVLPEPWSFWIYARVMGMGREIKAGSYQLSERVTPPQLLEKLVTGDFSSVGGHRDRGLELQADARCAGSEPESAARQPT